MNKEDPFSRYIDSITEGYSPDEVSGFKSGIQSAIIGRANQLFMLAEIMPDVLGVILTNLKSGMQDEHVISLLKDERARGTSGEWVCEFVKTAVTTSVDSTFTRYFEPK